MPRPITEPWLPEMMRIAPELDPGVHPERPQRQHALLINPFYAKDPRTSFGKHVLTPSLTLTSIAAATPAGWNVSCWDENLLHGPPPWQPFPQVLGITVHLTFARRAYELAAWYRKRGAIVVMGGLHAHSCPDEVAQHADVVAIGDGIKLWPRILADVEAGHPRKYYRCAFEGAYRDDPRPRRELLPKHAFLSNASVIATRGCHQRCGFCYMSTDGLQMPYQTRSPDQVVDDIRAAGQPYVVFIDNNLGSQHSYLRELCRAMRPLEIIWSAAVSMDVTDDPSLVREMAVAGCTGVFIGFESLEDENLLAARKRTPQSRDYARRIRILHEHGIQVNGSFVLGFDHDRKDIFERTTSWIEENRLECATFHILTPYPGTPLFRQLEAEGRLLHRDWELYDTGHVVFCPRHMTPQELAEGYAWCYQRLFSHRSIWLRRPVDVRAVLPYLAMSYLYKRSNRLWPFLIRHHLTGRVWRPLVEWSRRRHVKHRRRFTSDEESTGMPTVIPPVPAGV